MGSRRSYQYPELRWPGPCGFREKNDPTKESMQREIEGLYRDPYCGTTYTVKVTWSDAYASQFRTRDRYVTITTSDGIVVDGIYTGEEITSTRSSKIQICLQTSWKQPSNEELEGAYCDPILGDMYDVKITGDSVKIICRESGRYGQLYQQ